MITLPVDRENTRWAIYRISTAAIDVAPNGRQMRHQKWPVTNGGEIPGLESDLVYLLETTDVVPAHDSRLYRVVPTETIDVAANTLHTSYTVEPRPIPERVEEARNVEAQQFVRHFNVERVALQTALAVGILAALRDGNPVPARFLTFLSNYKSKVQNKLVPNYDRILTIISELEAGGDSDLDGGFAEPDPE